MVFLDPDEGVRGASVAVGGGGFDGACGVLIRFGGPQGQVVAEPPVDPNGRFAGTFAVPSDAAPGDVAVLAEGLLSSASGACDVPQGPEARTTFTVLASGLQPRVVPVKPERTVLLEGHSREDAHLKIVQGAQVRLRDGRLVSEGQDDVQPLQAVLDRYPQVVPSRLFDALSEEQLDAEKRRLETRSQREQGDKNLWFRLSYPDGTDVEALLDELNALDLVEIAYPEPLPAPDPATPDWRSLQGYRETAPGGIDVDGVADLPGGRGQHIQVIDIEYDFNSAHEDLPAVAYYANGTPTTPFSNNHGTAVLSQLVAVDNGFGLQGMVDQAAAGFVNQKNTEDGYDMPDAIAIATANSAPGDVILLESQTAGANGGCGADQVGCVPSEYLLANYDAVVAATSAGIIVVAAAGNGSEDLDAPEYAATFGSRPDSGAIIVGAGGAPGCTAPARGRLDFSTFGSRVDLQGWGECVAAAGYGGLQGASEGNDAYTNGFSGTSSASPIVASAAGILSSVAQAHGDADGLTSAEARAVLQATGTPQDVSAAALAGEIGPLPDLGSALAHLLPPTAHAGGPYTTSEGTDVVLSAAGSSDAGGGALSYAWDLDADGVFGDAAGVSVPFSQVGQDGVFPVAVQVTDSDGLTDTASSAVTVDNAVPTLMASVDPASGPEGTQVTASVTVTDPGWLDVLTATVDWGTGDGPQPLAGLAEQVRPDATLTATAPRALLDDGVAEVVLCGADDDTTTCQTLPVTLSNVGPQADLGSPLAVHVGGVPTVLAPAGTVVPFEGHVIDAGSDDLTATFDTGDGTAPVVQVSLAAPPANDPDLSFGGAARDELFTLDHVFAGACAYEVQLQAGDDDGGSGSSSLRVLSLGNAWKSWSATAWKNAYRSNAAPDPYDEQELLCLLSITGALSEVFDELRDASTVALAHDVLLGQGRHGLFPEQGQFDRELLATWLNVAAGGIALDDPVDRDADGISDGPLSALLADAEGARADATTTPLTYRELTRQLARQNR